MDLLYHHANYGEDCVLYTGCRRTSVSFVCYRQVCLQGSKATSTAFTRWSKMGFSPLQTQCCNKGKIWHGEAVPRAKFHLYRGRNVGRQSLKLSKFQILPTNLPCRSDSFAHCTRLQVAFNFVIWSLLGHLVAKLLNKSKKLGGAKITDLLCRHSKYGENRESHVGCRRQKCYVFCLSVCFFVAIWNYEVCDNGNAMKSV